MRRVSFFVGAIFYVVITGAQAQQNPLSSFLDAIGKVGKGISSSSQEESGPLVDILKTYASANTSTLNAGAACEAVTRGYLVKKSETDLKLASYGAASAGYLLNAQDIAQCAVGPAGASQVSRIPVSQAIDQVGANLAMSVIAAKAGGLVIPQVTANAQNALALLEANKTANGDLIRKLKETGLVGDDSPTTASSAEVIQMTAKDAVSDFKSNNFAFKSKYDGKVLAISGVIQNITGSGQRATVTLVGHKPADLNDQGFQDLVRCEVSDQAALSKVINLKRGQMVKVMGLYKPATQAFPVGVELQKCQPN
ncbi:OB-fold protein [Herbaspirillum huttiense]|uniref:Nucleic acid binding protein n=1 Tax=Herbaspirillum huttiense subsp. lycopersici TaxID=3074428 RepID=A0ABU2EKL1_9BURK|nr:hypothetical protein [Herbaspirillum huttiense]MDR9848686.1 hypothetical protein [Herbaspirillum huttiense SE1]